MVPRARLHPPPRPDLARDVSAHSKLSVPSSSQSNEADDEQSASDHSLSSMDDQPSPTYVGEDTRLTSSKELAGFYMYGWAAEVTRPFRLANHSTE
jgi:UMF1 family MFS transporter